VLRGHRPLRLVDPHGSQPASSRDPQLPIASLDVHRELFCRAAGDGVRAGGQRGPHLGGPTIADTVHLQQVSTGLDQRGRHHVGGPIALTGVLDITSWLPRPRMWSALGGIAVGRTAHKPDLAARLSACRHLRGQAGSGPSEAATADSSVADSAASTSSGALGGS
jgi:hypothetical protein